MVQPGTGLVLVDTSLWVRHLREGDADLEVLLNNAAVVCHPFILGELACGSLRNRDEILSLLRALPMIPVIPVHEILYFIDRNDLSRKGLGLVDVQLLASAVLSDVQLWTSDKHLKTEAARLGITW